MIPITVKVTMPQRNYLDKIIKKGKIASYGHAMRFLLDYFKSTQRVVERLKADNAVYRAKIEELTKEKGEQYAYETSTGLSHPTNVPG